MNILVINASVDLYGANRILLQTLKFLKPRRIILIVPQTGLLTEFLSGNTDYLHVRVVVVKTLPVVFRAMNIKDSFKFIKNIYVFFKTLKKIKSNFSIDWAYVNTLSSFATIKILKNLRIKVLVHVHEILENERLLTNAINRYSVKWSDKIIAVSEPVKLNLEKAVQSNKIVTVLNGIKDMYMPVASENSIINIVFFGRIKPEKGALLFLDAIALLNKSTLAKAKFFIIGSAAPGGEHFVEQLKKDISSHIAKDKIYFESFIADIRVALNNADVVVVPSLMQDPFPTTILEAASAGKPVIATNTGGAVQSVKDNITGFLISPDAKKFSNCLQHLIESDELRNQMGKNARDFYFKNFTPEIFENNFMREIKSFERTFN